MTILNFLKKFHDEYINFKEDIKCLPEINFGENEKLKSCFDFEEYFESENYRYLLFYLGNSGKEKKDYYLIIEEDHERINGYITNRLNLREKEYIEKNVTIDNELLKKYLDFYKKYSSLIDIFNNYRNNYLCYEEDISILCEIQGDIFTEVEAIKLIIYDKDTKLDIYINIDEDFFIDYDSSYVYGIDGNKKEIIDGFLNELYADFYVYNVKTK